MNPFKIKIEPDDKDATQKIIYPSHSLMISKGIKIFGNKRPYEITKIQNVLKGQHFRYEGEWCRLNFSNPHYFLSSNKFGTALKKIVEHFDKFVAVVIPENKKKQMNKIKYLFKKISNNHERIRDESVECFTCSSIEIGRSVYLTALPRDSGAIRCINTSPVKSIVIIGNAKEILTESGSVYRIEEVKENK